MVMSIEFTCHRLRMNSQHILNDVNNQKNNWNNGCSIILITIKWFDCLI